MIPRVLVPTQLLPQSKESVGAPKRVSTYLDSRSVVPSDLPIVPLESRTNIPSHIPLEVLGERMLVPRDMPITPLDARSAIPSHVPLTILDSRVAIPKDAHPAEMHMAARLSMDAYRHVLEPDVMLTGEVNLMSQPVEEREVDYRWLSQSGTLMFHILLVTFAVFWPTLFPPRIPTQSELELASRSLGMVYIPPTPRDLAPYSPPSAPPSPKMRIDPRVLRDIAPPRVEAPTQPENKAQRDLPSAPAPQVQAPPERELRAEAPRPQMQLESPSAPKPNAPLLIPRMSAGKALEESMRGGSRGSATNQGGFADPIPRRPGDGSGQPGGGGGGGGGGEGQLGGAIQMLTPDEGVDFTNYLDRVLASVRRNWYAIIPESARMGEKGRVMLQFRIMRDGNVPYAEPNLLMSSTKEPLDRAAMSSIRASSPFEQLPPAFSGPFIELRFIFLYNLPIEAAR
jgi:TonB family protein